jgi:hypothetical protein
MDVSAFSGLPSFSSGLIAMLEAYCDESDASIRGGSLLVLAGYLADDADWRLFNKAWESEVLRPYSIPYFHAKDLRSQNAKLYRHLNLKERRDLLDAACSVIGRHVKAGGIVYMRPADWKQFTTPRQRSRWGSAYGICMELMLAVVLGEIVGGPERVSVFLEDGHANATDAIRKIHNYKHDTEPIEYPEITGGPIHTSEPEHPELKMREESMRIGDIALVSKVRSMPTQAADLLAYLVGSALSPIHPVFEGTLDALLPLKPHALSGWGPDDVSELVKGMTSIQADREELRMQNWEMKRILRSEGMKVFQLPWGMVVDHKPEEKDERSVELKSQVNSILEKFKRIHS